MFLLHIPYFYFSYFPSEEALFLLLAQRICSGWALYSETWDYHSPIITWLYTFFYWFFESNSLFLIRFLAVLGVYVCGLFINHLMVRYKFVPDTSLLPAFLFVTFASVPWYEFCFNQELLASLLFTVAIIILCRTLIDDCKTWENFLVIGLILGACFSIKYHALFYCIIVLSAYVSVSAARIREITTILLGFILSVVAIEPVLRDPHARRSPGTQFGHLGHDILATSGGKTREARECSLGPFDSASDNRKRKQRRERSRVSIEYLFEVTYEFLLLQESASTRGYITRYNKIAEEEVKPLVRVKAQQEKKKKKKEQKGECTRIPCHHPPHHEEPL